MTDGNLLKKFKRNIKVISFGVSPDEWQRYMTLPGEKKRFIRAIVKTLINNPSLLDNVEFWQKFILTKSFSQYVCPVCLTPFSNYKAYALHIRYAHHDNVCPVCGKSFTSTDALLDHLRKKHLGV